MSVLGAHALARASLTYLAEPGDPALGALLEICEPAEVLAAIKAGLLPAIWSGYGDSPDHRRALERALRRWRIRLPGLPGDAAIEAACRDGIRLVCPGDPEWPAVLDELGPARPYALWLRGRADLRLACLRSVSIVGSRAATGYGAHVAGEIAADLAELRLGRGIRRLVGYKSPTARNDVELLSPASTGNVRGAHEQIHTEYGLTGARKTRVAGPKDAGTHSSYPAISGYRAICGPHWPVRLSGGAGFQVAAERPEVRSWPAETRRPPGKGSGARRAGVVSCWMYGIRLHPSKMMPDGGH
jgi:DNA recombination-mediator protein A